MLGHVMEWYYGYVGGIRQATNSVGWREILIAPNPGFLTSAETTVPTPYGRVASRWRKDGATFRLEVEVPIGVKATAILPSGTRKTLHSGKQTVQEPLVQRGKLSIWIYSEHHDQRRELQGDQNDIRTLCEVGGLG
jgi:hypothetical protein